MAEDLFSEAVPTQHPRAEDYVYTLSKVNFALPSQKLTHEEFEAISDGRPDSKLNVLDALALILVRRAKHDVVATSCRITRDVKSGSTTYKFYYCRNEPSVAPDNNLQAGDKLHAKKLLKLVCSFRTAAEGVHQCTTDLFSFVMTNCFPKIKSQYGKVQEAWKKAKVEVPMWEEPDVELTKDILESFEGWAKLRVDPTRTWKGTLLKILEKLEREDLSPKHIRSVLSTIRKFGTSEKIFDRMYFSPHLEKLRRQMAKLARFHSICYILASNAKQYSDHEFELEEMEPPKVVSRPLQSPAAIVAAVVDKFSEKLKEWDLEFDRKSFLANSNCRPEIFDATPKAIKDQGTRVRRKSDSSEGPSILGDASVQDEPSPTSEDLVEFESF
ncbi:MAG: hypothetical protein M1825_003945 [Sarcosagium campestre]|nr:MAG: hypothetical protein M1825_003945 [Sarcosagium campestre]